MTTENMIPITEFCSVHHLEMTFVQSLEQQGLIETTVVNEIQYVEVNQLPKLEQIVRLHRELNINFEGIDAISHLLNQMEDMQRQITELKNRLHFFEEKEQKFY
ncbi:MAG TPA: chaperone modulator CbpM [Chitinophagaceae bacterium]|nr:chaperone modulator CbpM [Chitinophagaceae bacterium]